LRAAALEAIVELQTGFRVYAIQHMGVALVVMRDDHGLVLVPVHVPQNFLCHFRHMFARRLVVRKPCGAPVRLHACTPLSGPTGM
jgi:hypothetical protein